LFPLEYTAQFVPAVAVTVDDEGDLEKLTGRLASRLINYAKGIFLVLISLVTPDIICVHLGQGQPNQQN